MIFRQDTCKSAKCETSVKTEPCAKAATLSPKTFVSRKQSYSCSVYHV